MSDWKVGDLAVCVDDSVISHPDPLSPAGYTIHTGKLAPAKGAREKVVHVSLSEPINPRTGLREPCGCACLHFADGTWGVAQRFRKIRPDEHEACEPEFVTLLKRNRVTA